MSGKQGEWKGRHGDKDGRKRFAFQGPEEKRPSMFRLEMPVWRALVMLADMLKLNLSETVTWLVKKELMALKLSLDDPRFGQPPRRA